MKPYGRSLFAAGAFATALTLIVLAVPEAPAQSASATGESGEVVLMRCEVGVKQPTVRAYQASTHAPEQKSSSCAESLALLLKDGFELRETGHYDERQDPFMVMALTR